MYIEKEKEITLNDLILGQKIFKCKKDIPCENGIYKKGSAVFLSNARYSHKLQLFDVDNWDKSEGYSIFCCNSDFCTETISVKNFYEYFELNKQATSKLEEINAEAQKYTDSWCRLLEIRNFWFNATLVTLLLPLVIAIFTSSQTIRFYCFVVIFFSFAFFLLGIVFHFSGEIIYKKRGEIYSQRRIEVINAAKRM